MSNNSGTMYLVEALHTPVLTLETQDIDGHISRQRNKNSKCCVSRARTLHASALSPLVSSYGVCQLAAMGFFTLMKGSARNVCTFFNVQ